MAPVDIATWANIAAAAVTAVATIALAWFGNVQIREAKRDRVAHSEELTREKNDRIQAAVNTLRAELARVSRLSARWSQADLVDLASRGGLRPLDLQPPDWGLIVNLLGQLGMSTVTLASVAYGSLTDAGLRAHELVWITANLQGETLEPLADPVLARQRQAKIEWAKQLAGDIKQDLTDAAEGLNDAISMAPQVSEVGEIPGHLKSRAARLLREAVLETGSAVNPSARELKMTRCEDSHDPNSWASEIGCHVILARGLAFRLERCESLGQLPQARCHFRGSSHRA